MKNDRLFQLVYLLLEKGNMSAPALSRELEVSVRTVYRDVETLSMAGVPIYTTPGKNGGISLMEGYSFDKTLLSDYEQNQLLFAVQSLKAAEQQVDGLLSKLGRAFCKSPQNWITVDFSRWGLKQVDSVRFETIKNSILAKQVLQIAYCSTSGEMTKRRIHPLRLIYKDKHWYLQSYCLKAEDFRLFKVSRIVEITPTDEHFAQNYEGEIPPIEMEGVQCSETNIKLKISARLAFRVYDEFDRESITVMPDGSMLVEICFPMDSWVIGYIFSFGTDVEILQPPELRYQLSEYAEKIATHHNLDRQLSSFVWYDGDIKQKEDKIMSNENGKFCQSCAMPMEGAEYGTESNGSKSTDYCNYCYDGGKFCADVTMEQMIDFCAKPMADATGMTADDAKTHMAAFFPQLKRWH